MNATLIEPALSGQQSSTVSDDALLRLRFRDLRARTNAIEVGVITERELTEPALLNLVDGRCLAVKIPGFINPAHSLQIAEKLMRAKTWGRYETEGASGIEINGSALFECGGDRACPDYFRHALLSRRAVRRLLAPLASPIDVIQAELDSVWSAGAQVLTLARQKCHVGLQRAFRNGGEALWHTDRSRIDFVNPKTARMKFQIALNTYLATTLGGELELWNLLPDDQLYELSRFKEGPTYAIRGELLPPPDLVVAPQPGDFIMFNAAKIHRVRPVHGNGARVTVSGFAGYFNHNEPLQIFS